MENRLGLTTVFLSADNEHKLQLMLFDLNLETAKTADVITIYPKGSKVIAWVRVESKHVELAAGKLAKKKTRKKKVTKA
jgi:hypothetical protein